MPKKITPDAFMLIRNPDVVLREEDADGALLFNPDTNQIRVINATGLFIWEQCDGRHDVAKIIKSMKESFDKVPEADVEVQVKTFIADMRASGFIGVPEKSEK